MRDIRFRGKRLDGGEKIPGTELTFIRYISDRKGVFKCACGKETEQYFSYIEGGRVKSCGCLRYKNLSKRNSKHSGCGSRLYRIWRGLFKRCENKNSTDYYNYGARGIEICKEWHSFEVFREWADKNGYSDLLTIERKNTNGNYEPDNCCWITKADQAINKRKRIVFPQRNALGRFVKNA